MSSALGIAAVTAVLKNLLDNRLIEQGVAGRLGDVTVSALPPDRIATGADEKSQLNLFLYRLTPNTAWRKGSGEHNGRARPLAIDLHYLLTAYGEQDLQAEILLGFGMQTLYQAGTLGREEIRSSLAVIAPRGSASVIAPARAALSESSLADAVEHLEITPEFLSTEEISRLWSTLQARYRPSTAYKVSAVLIEANT
jgi:Pvc16 N-terminal domain